jgi:amino acid permease
MKIVVWRGSIAGVFLYASVGVFGYLTFYKMPEELKKQNILLAPYGNNIAIILVSINFNQLYRVNSLPSSQSTSPCPYCTYHPKKQ